MKHSANKELVTTISERCRVCYTCVRECPAKAIRIADGQAQVIPERCIGCGNCVRVCSQQAKQVLDGIDATRQMIEGGKPTAAIIAPSFPAEFPDIEYQQVIGMLKTLGFDSVHEVAFGADLVAREYRRLLKNSEDSSYIATSCPAVVAYVERYSPEIAPKLAPIVSPMIAAARTLRELAEDELQIVFIGPCIAKKGEAASRNIAEEIDEVLTFAELQQMLDAANLNLETASGEAADFDPPYAGTGALFPISRGLLQAAGIEEDLLTGEVVATDGRTNFVEAIKEFEQGHLDARLLEVLCCNGCIMGAGMTCSTPKFSRRGAVSRFVRERYAESDRERWQQNMQKLADLNLHREFMVDDQRIPFPSEDDLKEIMQRMGKFEPQDELNCGACGYETCREHAVAIFKGLAENEMCLPNTIEQLRTKMQELAVSNEQLADTQEALMHSERLASMGQLAAGVAHEVNNPLGIVLMYAHMLLEEAERQSEMHNDLSMIVEQADRCKKIVSRLLHFARQNKVVLHTVNLRELTNRVAASVKHNDSVTLEVVHKEKNPCAELDGDQIAQVCTNLITNALDAMPDGGTITIETDGDDENVYLRVCDTGTGISEANQSKIFEPFFTLKQIGKGTGLGLAVSYGIIKMHKGSITVESNNDPNRGPTGTQFKISLPRTGQQQQIFMDEKLG
ncbi:MAG: [Fe-Fe] hydrogenase large subunit C-terminal domain-containing protein [Lentisphaeria bacterium]